MKSGWLALLVVAVVLLIVVESHKYRGRFQRRGYRWGKSRGQGSRGKPMGQWHGNHWKSSKWGGGKGGRWSMCNQERPRNCSDFVNGTCVACDDGFTLKTFYSRRCNYNKTICFRPYCCRGCANCSSRGVCLECKQGLKLFNPPNSNITKCVRYCPVFYKFNNETTPKCELKEAKQDETCGKSCMECSESGVCLKCVEGLRLIKLGDRTTCRKACPPYFKGRLDPENQRTICEEPFVTDFHKGKRERNPKVSDVPE